MSGHSKWHKIRHQKTAKDQKKSREFGRLVRDIKIAARSEGDPTKNAALRDAIERAKKANMPQANIDKVLFRKDSDSLSEVVYEGFGPGGVGVVVIAQTDNSNRTVAEVRAAFKAVGSDLGGPNSVRWKFDSNYSPQFPIQLDKENASKLEHLIVALEELEDVEQIHTDAIY